MACKDAGGSMQNHPLMMGHTAAISLTPVQLPSLLAFACLCMGMAAQAQPTTGAGELAPVTISAKANRNPVEKSYRKMLQGMDLFEQQRTLSPNGSLRFKLLPRKRETDMNTVRIDVIGSTVDLSVPVSPDHTFTLARSKQAFDEDAQVVPNRKRQTMTWRADIRTPGLPPDTRRLGDLRLECRVGMEAGLVSTSTSIISRVAGALFNTPAYCDRKVPLYLFFSDRPLFSVTLTAGTRREILAIDQLYAAASDDPNLKNDLPQCDCEVLVDRTYFLPLGDLSWPDDTLIEFEYMDDESTQSANAAITIGASTQADVLAALGPGTVVRFDSGFEVWVYRGSVPGTGSNAAVKPTELVILFSPAGTVKKNADQGGLLICFT
jgi:hypothetical protein